MRPRHATTDSRPETCACPPRTDSRAGGADELQRVIRFLASGDESGATVALDARHPPGGHHALSLQVARAGQEAEKEGWDHGRLLCAVWLPSTGGHRRL
jgi:hypothetical protein